MCFPAAGLRLQRTVLTLEPFNSGISDAAVDFRLATWSVGSSCNGVQHKPTHFKQVGNHFPPKSSPTANEKWSGKSVETNPKCVQSR